MCVTSVYGTNSAIQILCQYDKLSDLYVINHGIFLVNYSVDITERQVLTAKIAFPAKTTKMAKTLPFLSCNFMMSVFSRLLQPFYASVACSVNSR